MIWIYPTSMDSKNIKGKNIESKKCRKIKILDDKKIEEKYSCIFSPSLVMYAFSISISNIFTSSIASNLFLALTF
jgi:hypothetical protein